MKNFRGPGQSVEVAAPAPGVLSGAPVLVGSLFGIASTDAATGAPVNIVTEGVFEMSKAQGALDAGDPVYYAVASGLVGDTGPGTVLVGVAVEGAGADAPTARVRLNGTTVGPLPAG
jgi:predicted RecA/RadA family phage recombinase